MRIIILLTALFLTGCDQQPTPIAPSPTVPPSPAPSPAPPQSPTSFSVTLNANGGIAYLHEPWSGTVIVSATNAGVPASVGVRCGDDPEQVFSGFVGARAVSCTFQQAGTYPVTAAVVSPSGLTTSAAITLLAYQRPMVTFYVEMNWRKVNASLTQPEYEFTVRPSDVSETLSEIHWNFGDEGGADTDRTRVVRHQYTSPPGPYVVTVTTKTNSHGTVSGTTRIEY